MDTYTIKKAYPWTRDSEIEISSENLLYSELNNLSGCQSMNKKNNELIRDKCFQISELIREIEKLNVSIQNERKTN